MVDLAACALLQVKNFGRRGRTKWTHLVDEDTTNFESPWCDTLLYSFVTTSSCQAGARTRFARAAWSVACCAQWRPLQALLLPSAIACTPGMLHAVGPPSSLHVLGRLHWVLTLPVCCCFVLLQGTERCATYEGEPSRPAFCSARYVQCNAQTELLPFRWGYAFCLAGPSWASALPSRGHHGIHPAAALAI
jgi:hypothetical protein